MASFVSPLTDGSLLGCGASGRLTPETAGHASDPLTLSYCRVETCQPLLSGLGRVVSSETHPCHLQHERVSRDSMLPICSKDETQYQVDSDRPSSGLLSHVASCRIHPHAEARDILRDSRQVGWADSLVNERLSRAIEACLCRLPLCYTDG